MIEFNKLEPSNFSNRIASSVDEKIDQDNLFLTASSFKKKKRILENSESPSVSAIPGATDYMDILPFKTN